MLKRIKYKKMANKSGKNFCDELWSILVKKRDGNKCMVCDNTMKPNSHHLITRKVFKYRWDTDNGVTLCPGHHEFDVRFSAHTAPWALEEWMIKNRPKQHARHVECRNDITNEPISYPDIYAALEEEHLEVTGEYYRISRLDQYRLFKNAKVIDGMHGLGHDVNHIAEQFKVSKNMMKKFMTDNKIL